MASQPVSRLPKSSTPQERAAQAIYRLGTHAVALHTDLDELLNLAQRLTDAQVPHVVVRENDPPYEEEVMAIGVRPGPKSKLRRYFSNYPLIK